MFWLCCQKCFEREDWYYERVNSNQSELVCSSLFSLLCPPQFFRCVFEWNGVSMSFLILVCERLEDSHCQFFGFAPNLSLHVF